MTLDVGAIRLWLAGNATPTDTADSHDGQQYLGFYDLVFAATHHEMGWLPAGEFKVFTQHFGRRSTPRERRGTVFVLHGYLDHSGLQGPSIRRLLDLGFEVVTHDHPGHGLSSGDRVNIQSFEHYVDALVAVVDHYAGLPQPHIVMGHSLGGAISMTHMLKYPHVFQKAVLVAPLFRPKGWRWIGSMHRVAGRFLRGHPRLWRNNTRDAAYRQFVREVDPMLPRFIPVEWIGSMFRWIKEFHGLEKVDASVLVLQGTDDGTVDWRGNVPLIRSKFSDLRLHMIRKGRHQLLNELDVWQDAAWRPIELFLIEHSQ
jgi:alpha-beta hydrolase superfamily lysophospholipase